MPLDTQTGLNITRWTREYIAGLIEHHNGEPEDLGTMIHWLHDQPAISDQKGRHNAGGAGSSGDSR